VTPNKIKLRKLIINRVISDDKKSPGVLFSEMYKSTKNVSRISPTSRSRRLLPNNTNQIKVNDIDSTDERYWFSMATDRFLSPTPDRCDTEKMSFSYT